MEIGSILQRSWDLAWKYKSLWVFGLFIQGVGGANVNSFWDPSDSDGLDSLIANPAFMTLLGVGLVIGFIFLIMHFISSGAHIDAVNKLTRGGTYSFGSSFSVGVDNFWRFVGLSLLMLGAVIALILILALPGILFFLIHPVIGVLGLMILIPALLAGLVVILMIYWLAQRAVVVRGSSIGDALDEAYFLFRTYLGTCVKFALVLLLISIVVGVAFMVILGIIAAPFIAMALAAEGGLIPALVSGIPIVLVVMLVLEGMLGSFFHSANTLFYFRLLEIPVQQPAGGMTDTPTM
jgi:hypothetical protein